MPDEAHIETVELRVESKSPSKSQIQGLHDVIGMLKEIEGRYNRVNSMTISARGLHGSRQSSFAESFRDASKATDQLVKQAQAAQSTTRVLREQASVWGEIDRAIARTNETGKINHKTNEMIERARAGKLKSTSESLDAAGTPQRKNIFETGSGRAISISSSNSGIESVKEFNNLAAAEKVAAAERRKARRQTRQEEKVSFAEKEQTDKEHAQKSADQSKALEQQEKKASSESVKRAKQEAEAISDAGKNKTDKAKAFAALDAHNAAEQSRAQKDAAKASVAAQKEADSFFSDQERIKNQAANERAKNEAREQADRKSAGGSNPGINQAAAIAAEDAKINAAADKSRESERVKREARDQSMRKAAGGSQAGINSQAAMAAEDAKRNADADKQAKLSRAANMKRIQEERLAREAAEKSANESINKQREYWQNKNFKDEIDRLAKTKAALDKFKQRTQTKNAMAEYSGPNFLSNLSRVTAWSASVAVLYGSINLVKGGLASLIETGTQTARLGQVFQGVGGNARQLADDVMRLASNHGRSRDEAMQSAIQWSRLGLSRVQVNEAVRVSLMAANVAEITASEATERLSSIMAAYRMNISGVGSALGQLNAISNKQNVTVLALMDGFSRAGSIAQQAGLSFSETAGIIGGAVGLTGQSGANIGNGIKSMIGALNDTNKQALLREKFKIELTTDGGDEIKNASKALSDLYIAYQKMTDAERSHMLFDTFGKQQASRVAAMMDSYIKGQALAIAAQMNLNSAENENIEIKSALKSQLTGLVAEWERFVNIQGNRGPVQALGTLTGALRGAVQLMNTDTGGAIGTGIMSLMSVLSVRMALTAMRVKEGGGFIVNTFRGIREAMMGLVGVMGKVNNDFVKKWTTNRKIKVDIFDESGAKAGQTFATETVNAKGLTAAIAALNNKADAWTAKAAAAGSATSRIGFTAAAIGARALGAALVAVVEIALPMLLIFAGLWLFGKWMNASAEATERAERKLAGFNDEAERANAAANSAADAMRLLDTVSKSYEKSGSKKQMIEGVSSIAYFKGNGTPDDARNNALKRELMTMEQQGNTAGVLLKFEDLRRQKLIQRTLEQTRAMDAIKAEENEAKERLRELGVKSLSKGEREEKHKLENRLQELGSKRVGQAVSYTSDMAQDAQEFADGNLQQLTFLEKQKTVLESISAIYQNMPQFSATDRLNAEVAALDARIAAGKAMLEQLQKPDNSEKAKKEQKDATDHMRRELEKQKEIAKTLSGEISANPFEKSRNDFQALRDYDKVLQGDSLENAFSLMRKRKDRAEVAGGKDWGIVGRQRVKDYETPAGQDLVNMIDELAATEKRILALKKLLKEDPTPSTDSSKLREGRKKKTQEQLDKDQSDRDAADSAEARALAEQIDRDNVTKRFGANINAGFAVGDSEAEQLANTEIGLNARILALKQQSDQAQAGTNEKKNAELMLLQAIGSLEENGIRKAEMRVKLEVDRTNQLKEQNREYQKSLLMSGPADLLRKLAVKSLADRGGNNLGSFLSLGSSAKQDFVDYKQPFTARDYRENMGFLGSPRSFDQEQSAAAKFRNDKSGLYAGAGEGNPLISASMAASIEVGKFAGSAMAAGDALMRLVAQVEQKIGSLGTPVSAPSFAGVWNPLDESAQGGLLT